MRNNKVRNQEFGVRCSLFLLSSIFLLPSVSAHADETIVTHEIERQYFKDGSLLKLEGQYEYTYYLDMEKNILTRTRVYDFVNKKVTPDNTEYHMERQLLSHPTNADRYILTPVIRAAGQTSADTVELIVIDDAYVQTTSSTSNELFVSRAKRLK
jgi:hypothetical protein